jgi:hypothetical protein
MIFRGHLGRGGGGAPAGDFGGKVQIQVPKTTTH